MERLKRNLTQKELAEKCGLTQAVVARIEIGKTAKPQQCTLNAIYKALNLDEETIKHLSSDSAYEVKKNKNSIELKLHVPSNLIIEKEDAYQKILEILPKLENDSSMTLALKAITAIYNDENSVEYMDKLKIKASNQNNYSHKFLRKSEKMYSKKADFYAHDFPMNNVVVKKELDDTIGMNIQK